MAGLTAAAPRPVPGRLRDHVVDRALAADLATTGASTVAVLRLAVLDWLGVAIAGAREPSASLLREVLLEEGGNPQSTVVGARSG
ncbi:hypothetical protein BJF78_23635 [Pseudonocardia sp. CNS-139]|nr:hypothetical protein BJF78_23635 [Pseudonocardia sp. CNS-139]